MAEAAVAVRAHGSPEPRMTRVRRDTLQLQKGEGDICILGGDWPRARQLMHLYRPPLLSFPIMPLSQRAAQSIKYSSEK